MKTGKGFAVVAEEIRQLSEQTKRCNERITTDIISGSVEDAQHAMDSMEHSADSIREQNELIETTKNKFETINDEVVTGKYSGEIREYAVHFKQYRHNLEYIQISLQPVRKKRLFLLPVAERFDAGSSVCTI